MAKVSAHFSLDEIKCHCGCGQAHTNKKLYRELEAFRTFCGGLPYITHCVNRCSPHNKAVGGSFSSKHLLGMAHDGHVSGLTIKQLHKKAKKAIKKGILTGGVGFYPWGLHIDVGLPRTWNGK